MQASYRIPEANLELLKQRLAKISRRCHRIKIEPPVLTIGQHEDVEYTHRDEIMGDSKRVRRYFPVTLDSVERPKIDGFEFAAVISPVNDEDGKLLGNVLRMVPGFTGALPERYRQATNHCDHCNTDRRRLETFVIANPDGFKQVGRNCLANYLGLTNPHMLAEIAQMLIDANDLCSMSESDGFGSGASVPERVPVDEVLQIAASAIRQYGWLSGASAKQYEKQSTAQRVREWVFGNKKTRDQFEHPLTVIEADKTLAAETEAWLETLTQTNQADDYRYNLSLLAQATSVTGKNFGILVSAINAYSKEKEREIRRNQRFQEDKNSQFVGQVGERMTFENLTVVYTTTFERDNNFGYGQPTVTHFYKIKDAAGNLIVYFASNDMGWEQGAVIPKLVARVKKHEDRPDKNDPTNTVKQTVITRASLPKPEPTPEQKLAKKGALKLRCIMKLFPHTAQEVQIEDKVFFDRLVDSEVYNLLFDLEYQVRREA